MTTRRIRLFSAWLVFTALAVSCWTAPPVKAQQSSVLGPVTVAFTASNQTNTLCGVSSQNSASFYMVASSGATMGPIDAEVSVDGVNWSSTNISTIAGAVQAQPFTPTTGTTYQVGPLIGGCVRLRADSTWTTQSVTTVFRAQASLGANAQTSLPPVQVSAPLAVTCASPGQNPCAVSTPSSGPAATASAGAAIPANGVQANSISHCVVPAGSTPNVTAGNAIANQCQTNGSQNVWNLSTTSPAPYATAVSPAPGNIAAVGYNAGGAAAPVICTKQITVQIAATTQSTETVVVPSASGKIIYICHVTMNASTSAASSGAYFGLASSNTNTCGALTNIYIAGAAVGTGSLQPPVTAGVGVGVVTQTGTGLALCFFNATASPGGVANLNIMYEQFLHSLSPEQVEEYCSIPKRCLLYGLVKHLDRLLDRVESPIP